MLRLLPFLCSLTVKGTTRKSLQSVNSTRTTYFGNKVKWLLVLWKLYDCYYLTWLLHDWQLIDSSLMTVENQRKSLWRHNMANLRDATWRICDVTTWRISMTSHGKSVMSQMTNYRDFTRRNCHHQLTRNIYVLCYVVRFSQQNKKQNVNMTLNTGCWRIF